MRHLFIFLSACLLVSGMATAQDDVSSSRRNAIVRAIEQVSPAVVTINVVDIQRQRALNPGFDDFFGLFERSPVRTREHRVESIGTGFLFTDQGHILTNYHVLQDADLIESVTLPDGRELAVEFVGADIRTDLAVLQAKAKDLPHVDIGVSHDLMVGEWVIAIGNPFGNMMADRQPSVSVGVVSANRRRVSRSVGGGERLYQGLIQTDAAINPGNSGGPLVNADGRVVGINTMIFSKSGGNQGLGFAIPADRARRVVEDIVQFGRRRNPWIGIRGDAVTAIVPQLLRQLDIRVGEGVLVSEIVTSSPAHAAGLRPGDVITEMNGEVITEPLEVDFLNWDLFVGDPVHLVVDRHGKKMAIRFQIEELPNNG